MKKLFLILSVMHMLSCSQDDSNENAGTVAGTVAGSTAGTVAGSTAGTVAGSTAGTVAGSTAGTVAGSTAGTVVTDCQNTPIETTCFTSISNIKQKIVLEGQAVEFEGVITAIKYEGEKISHLVLQDLAGGSWNGIWVYVDNTVDGFTLPSFNHSDRIRLSGSVKHNLGQIQIEKVSGFENLTSYQNPTDPIPPLLVSTSDIMTGGPKAMEYEGLLVEVQNVSVTAVEPPLGDGDLAPNHEFVLNNELRVNDFIYFETAAGMQINVYPIPMVGASFSKVIGILRLGNGDYKLEPRGSSDLVP